MRKYTFFINTPRKYDIPAGVLKAGKNVVTLKLTAMGGNGEIVKDKPYKIQCDAETISLEGEWKYNVGIETYSSVLTLNKMVQAYIMV